MLLLWLDRRHSHPPPGLAAIPPAGDRRKGTGGHRWKPIPGSSDSVNHALCPGTAASEAPIPGLVHGLYHWHMDQEKKSDPFPEGERMKHPGQSDRHNAHSQTSTDLIGGPQPLLTSVQYCLPRVVTVNKPIGPRRAIPVSFLSPTSNFHYSD